MVKNVGIFLVLLCSVFTSNADYWELPTCNDYYSADSNTYIYVAPACITTAKKRKDKSLDTCSGECLKKRPCQATVYKDNGNNKRPLYSFELINPYAPQHVFISNNGIYVISINDWGSAGIGKNVLVIYKSGKLLKNYSLADISPIPILDYHRTVSSILWFDQLEFIDNNMLKVSFRDKSNKKVDTYFDLKKIN